jgi:DNA-binding MurR/RpiR family transcriptional regulator
MKADFHSSDAGWGADAARRFADTALGAALVARLTEGAPQQRRLADFVLRNPLAAAARPIDELAAAAEVSAATISRFARDLGHSGFAGFRAALADAVGASLDPVSKLREGFGRPGAALRLSAARTVYTVGFGLSAHLAAMLALGLQPYREGVVNVVQYGGTEVAAGRLAAVGEGDLMLAISFPRYAADAVHLARFAREQGARIAAITDSVASPLARWADDLVTAPAVHPVLSSSSLPGLALIEALTAEFVMSDPAHVARAERLSAALRKYLVQEGG